MNLKHYSVRAQIWAGLLMPFMKCGPCVNIQTFTFAAYTAQLNPMLLVP
jgi:hypothetical protein